MKHDNKFELSRAAQVALRYLARYDSFHPRIKTATLKEIKEVIYRSVDQQQCALILSCAPSRIEETTKNL